MKKCMTFILTLLLIISFCGCSSQQPPNSNTQQPSNDKTPQMQDVKLLKTGAVKRISVTSLPEGYAYDFSGEDAEAITDYLLNLNLIDEFGENPNEYGGMTWVIAVEYENGDTTTVRHFGNMFIRTESGPWYKMDHEEASHFDTLLNELNN